MQLKPFWNNNKIGLAELHSHVGGGTTPPILWSLAHEQGLKLPTKDYWKFVDMVTVAKKQGNLNAYESVYRLPEIIQSSPMAIERSVYEIIGKAYRRSNVILHELRFNPMLRNKNKELDLDFIITAAVRGLERILLEYPYIKAGLILMLHRSFPLKYNEIIVEKAIYYKRKKAIIGIDIAGPRTKNNHNYKQYAKIIYKAREAGLGVTVHTGEEGSSIEEMRDVLEAINPQRIGHGILAYTDKNLMKEFVNRGIVLEICPTSNLNTNSVKNISHLKKIIRTLLKAGVKITINTDGPAINMTTIKQEMQLLYDNGIMTEKELLKANKNAFASSFINI